VNSERELREWEAANYEFLIFNIELWMGAFLLKWQNTLIQNSTFIIQNFQNLHASLWPSNP
jgi:hypothetical protein